MLPEEVGLPTAEEFLYTFDEPKRAADPARLPLIGVYRLLVMV